MTIGKLASAGGVGVETVRFYQRRGLLETPPRTDSQRQYGAGDLRQLHFIRKAQTAGFTLEEIKELLALEVCGDRNRARTLALNRIEALDAKIAQLEQARSALARLASDCSESGEGPCPILAAFGV